MKKIFSTLILLIALLSGANAQAPVIEGSSYYLPKTALQFTVLVEKRVFKPGEFAEFADLQTSNGAKVAVVFGNERTGLTDSQLDECNVGVTIPSSSNFGSLNLSHAVQIMSYHLFRKSLSTKNLIQAGYTPLSLERVDKMVQNITDEMQKIGFFKMPGREDMENFWRSILSRASLSEGEAKYLEKTFSKIAGLSQKNLIK